MLKSETILQLIIFGLSATIVGLLFIKIYPSSLVNNFKPKEENPLPKKTQVEKTVQKEADVKAVKKESTAPTGEVLMPNEISVPSANLNLAVAPGLTANNKWTLYDDKVSWLTTSQTPGNGNVIIYGHNRINLFANLYKLQTGDEITIKTYGKNFTYKVAEKRKVLPDEVDVIISDKQQLTLYTCDGNFDQKRLVVIAYLEDKTS